MNSNKTAVDHLSEFVESDRAELHYGVWCDGCGDRLIIDEARHTAGETKQLAAQLIVRLNAEGADHPTLWAEVVQDTVFDNFNAAIARGEYPENSRHGDRNWSHWILERASIMHGLHAIANFPFGEPAYQTPPTPEQMEARTQRHHDSWSEYRRKTPEMFAIKFRHHDACQHAGTQTIPYGGGE